MPYAYDVVLLRCVVACVCVGYISCSVFLIPFFTLLSLYMSLNSLYLLSYNSLAGGLCRWLGFSTSFPFCVAYRAFKWLCFPFYSLICSILPNNPTIFVVLSAYSPSIFVIWSLAFNAVSLSSE